jgi:hypothetical protein
MIRVGPLIVATTEIISSGSQISASKQRSRYVLKIGFQNRNGSRPKISGIKEYVSPTVPDSNKIKYLTKSA